MFEPKKVMVIDDSKLIRMTVRKILESQGVEVVELDAAEPLLEEPWRADDVNMLILDISLPGIDGLTALQQMQCNETLKCLPVMILSTYSDRPTVCKAIEYGAVEFMTKPVISENLINRVDSIIGPLHDGVSDCIYNEMSRAKRGGTCLSTIGITFGKPISLCTLRDMQKAIKGMLRSIDSVLISQERALIVVLPVTGQVGCMVVSKKISKALEGNTEIAADFLLSYVLFPENGDSADSLLALLKGKGSTPINDVC